MGADDAKRRRKFEKLKTHPADRFNVDSLADIYMNNEQYWFWRFELSGGVQGVEKLEIGIFTSTFFRRGGLHILIRP